MFRFLAHVIILLHVCKKYVKYKESEYVYVNIQKYSYIQLCMNIM